MAILDNDSNTFNNINNPDSNPNNNPNNPYGGWKNIENTTNTNNGEKEGYKIDVTPKNPLGSSGSSPIPSIAKKPKKNGIQIKYIAIAIILIFIAAVAIATLHKPAPVTTTLTTSIKADIYTFSACGSANAPGSYYVNSNFNTTATSGPCITINSSNVNLVCNGKSITGPESFTNKSPYSYAIFMNGKDNVTVSGCKLSGFSYGVYAANSSNVKAVNNNMVNNTMSGIYFSNTSSSQIISNKVSGSISGEGAIHIGNTSSGVEVENNTLISNSNMGIKIKSGGETIKNNYINATPVSFSCYGSNGLINASTASANKCTVNYGCNFLSCSVANYPVNVSQITLNPVFNGCGVIRYPGTYHISNNINAAEYAKAARATNATTYPCISIESSNVHLYCESNNITNSSSGYAIYAKSEKGLIINHCGIRSSKSGIMLENITGANVSNITVSSVAVGIMLENSDNNKLSGINVHNSSFGVYVNSSTLNSLNGLDIYNNTYGIYINNSLGNVYSNGAVLSNSKMDIYATNDSVNSGYSLMSNINCGLTDAEWTTCSNVVKPHLKFYPINSCTTIRYSGNYSLDAGILGTSAPCIKILSSNVRLSCGKYGISEQIKGTGIGIYAGKVNNVTIYNCSINGAKYGDYLNGTSNSSIYYGSSKNDDFGIYTDKSKGIRIINAIENNAGNAGIELNGSYNNSIFNGTFNSGEYGIYLYSSRYNIIMHNNGTGNAVGIFLNTNSTNNTIARNGFTGSSSYDYACTGGSSGIASEYGGINYGQRVSNCGWISGIAFNSGPIACNAFFHPSSYSLGSDSYYGQGATCEAVYSNATTIDCNNYTVTATNGGTFALFNGVHGGVIKDCILRGFTTPITIRNSSVKAINDKIYVNSTNASNPLINYGIGVFSSSNFELQNDTIISTSPGVVIKGSNSGNLDSVNSTSSSINYYIQNTTGTYLLNNFGISKGISLSMVNSTGNTFKDNSFNGSISGAICSGTSINNDSNIDAHGNYCSINSNCAWIGVTNC